MIPWCILTSWRLEGCAVAFTVLSYVTSREICVSSLLNCTLLPRLQLKTWMDLTKLKSLSMTVNVLAAVGDALIAGSLVYLLQRSRTGFRKSDTMISKLTMFTVNTGLLTSICATASLISILLWGNTFIYIAFYFNLGRLYSNSLLATLNAREGIRNMGDEDFDSLSLSFRTGSGVTSFRSGQKPKPTNISITIDTTQDFTSDLTESTLGSSISGSPVTLKNEASTV
ncbi:hypothetical protein HGRIS_009257 [Hohenbuehelia grisea]|uniref:DUF6534 domain-containing protein n=1 Tax=Hohenbuehelia grisea TaxID=104357 RepID=A0ABR3J0R6_9AGAR